MTRPFRCSVRRCCTECRINVIEFLCSGRHALKDAKKPLTVDKESPHCTQVANTMTIKGKYVLHFLVEMNSDGDVGKCDRRYT